MSMYVTLAEELRALVITCEHRRRQSVLLVEQNARQALRIAHRGYVLELGRTILSDTGAGLLDNPGVVEAYLGG